MDVLSDVLRAVRLTSALCFEVSASQPWIAATLHMKEVGATMMPGAGHVIPFHMRWSPLAAGRGPTIPSCDPRPSSPATS